MILIDTKAEAKSTSPINLSTSNEKPTLSFGELLKGVSVKGDLKNDTKFIKDGALVLSLDDEIKDEKLKSKDTKKLDGFLSLLQNKDTKLTKNEPLELNPKITENLTPKEIKYLIRDAKNYLRNQIVQSDGYKQSQIKDLPQTLKGLVALAKKFDINISKITLEQIQVKPNTINAKETNISIEIDAEIPKKVQAKTSDSGEALEIRQEVKPDRKTSKAPNLPSHAVEISEKKDIKSDIKSDIKTENKTEIRADVRADNKINSKSQIELKQTPIFKAQNTAEVATTQQVVLAKQFKPVEIKTPKERADDTLKLLLRGEKSSPTLANLTVDFSVATAKVLAPKATTEVSKSLESLLRGDSTAQNIENSLKTQQVGVHNVDSFEVKLNEAKQMIKYLSTDVKTAIEDYKSPFTRIKIQLNPQKLGEIDLTVVQRGKNLHINLTSNNAAINALALNMNDLKAQLSNNGINNASLNFNSSSENSSSSNSQQQSSQNEQNKAKQEYNYFNDKEQNEEILSSLEIVVPYYA